MPDKPPPCSTGKARFGSIAAAQGRLSEILDQPDPSRLYVPTGVISCPKCGGYHLTSRSGKIFKKGKKGRDRRIR